MKKHSILMLIISSLFACKENMKNNDLTLKVLDRQIVNGLSSISGFEAMDSSYFAVSDNTAFLYKISKKLDTIFSKQIIETISDSAGIIEKSQKPDFEALTYVEMNGKKELLLFGSGSKSPERDILIITGIQKEDSVKIHRLDELYEHILQIAELQKEQMNIEGVVVSGTQLYLFNRGNNAIWEFDYTSFRAYLEQPEKIKLPSFKSHNIFLPTYQNVQAGFSGATLVNDSSKILFTASLEDTDNWIDDGEVLGSYIGVIEVDLIKDGYRPRIIPISLDGKMLPIKVESAGIISPLNRNSIELLLLTDEDGKQSEAVRVLLGNL